MQLTNNNVCLATDALISNGVNSIGHVNNPLCFAIIPNLNPKTKSAEIYAGTYNAVKVH
jgi:hypothetical protein